MRVPTKPRRHQMIVDYTPELFMEVMDNMIDYVQTGETVCGAEDPAVIIIGSGFSIDHPELKGLSVVRVTERYVNPWKSETFLEFSNEDITAEEYERYEELQED
jgi:hypothetical protein